MEIRKYKRRIEVVSDKALCSVVFDKLVVDETPYRISFSGNQSFVHNFVHEVHVAMKGDFENVPQVKVFHDRGVHIVLARSITKRQRQREYIEKVKQSHVAWYDNAANVWKVEKA